jgi:KaiC/GvpD/RAD55 family RecA-like ATPase
LSRELRLPVELDTFLSRKGPVTMIVRGHPGTGTTTLALAMLEAFYGRKIFITGRRSRPGVLADYPWLGNVEGHEIEIIDSVRVGSGANRATSALDDPVPSGEQAVLAEVMEALPPPLRRAWGRRGGDHDELARQFAWMPVGLRRVLARLGSAERLMVVVDSWDAFIDELLDLAPPPPGGAANREEIERAALRLVAKGTAHLLLVLERSEETQLDYLVDGIVSTRYDSRDGVPERWLSILKLRGVRVDSESYPYTLEGGRFTCISPDPGRESSVPVYIEGDPEAFPGTIWPGAKAYAETFGRLRVGELTMIESDGRSIDAGIQTLTYPMIGSVLVQGGRVLYEPPPGVRLTDFWDAFKGLVTPERVHAQLRILSPGTVLPPGHPLSACLMAVPKPVAMPGGGTAYSQTPKGREFLTDGPPGAPPGLSVFSAENLHAIAHLTGQEYTPENLAMIAKSYEIGNPIHMVYLAKTGDPLSEGLRMLATTQLGLQNRQGRTFVYGTRPLTPGHVLTLRGAEEERAYNLLRVV